MILLIVPLSVAFLSVAAIIILRRAGGGRFPWLQFYLKGRESGFVFHEINLLRRVAVEARLENPTALFWSIKQLDKSIKGIILKYRSRSQEQDPEYNQLLGKLFELRKRVEFDQPKYKLGIKSSRKINPKQQLRLTLPGLGPFGSIVVESLHRYMAISYPQGPKLPDGFSWKNQKIGIYLWRPEDAGYYFQTKVLEDFFDKKYPILHVLHSENLVRTQKRNSVRVETDMSAELYPMKSIDGANETPEQAKGLRCRLVDLSEGGTAFLIGGKAKIGLPVKMQFSVGDSVIVMCGVVKGATFDAKKNRSLLHMQAVAPSISTRNRILTYVFNLFGEREIGGLARKPEASSQARKPEGIEIKASPKSPAGAPGAPRPPAPGRQP